MINGANVFRHDGCRDPIVPRELVSVFVGVEVSFFCTVDCFLGFGYRHPIIIYIIYIYYICRSLFAPRKNVRWIFACGLSAVAF